MLFHSLSGPEVHGVIDEMDRRAKSEAPAISSAIDRGDTETVGARLRVGAESWDGAVLVCASAPQSLGALWGAFFVPHGTGRWESADRMQGP